MDEKTMLLELKWNIEQKLESLEELIILSDPQSDDEEFAFLIKKASGFRDTLQKIEH